MARIWTMAAWIGLTWAGDLAAQPRIELPPAREGKLDLLTRVMLAEPASAALSDPHGLLAFCHDRLMTDAHVSLVKLDAKGNPSPAPLSWKIPHLPALTKNPNYALSAVFHPKLPLLYVWQDFTFHYVNPPPKTPAEMYQFNHLLIYDVAKESPELLASLCRGEQYVFGFHGGNLAIDTGGSFLYVPNLREIKNAGSMQVGRFKLDADGFPDLGEKEAKAPRAVRAKRLTDLNPAPHQITPVDYVYVFAMNQWGVGQSFIPLGNEAVLATGYQGLFAWHPDDKNIQVHGLPLKKPGRHLLGMHPQLPALFATTVDSKSLSWVEQTDGFLTRLPRQFIFPHSKLYSPPVVLAKTNQLAVGGQHAVFILNLDAKGMPAAECMKASVFNPTVKALVYSERFNRLYVGVELSK